MRPSFITALIVFSVPLGTSARAADAYDVDPVHSSVIFRVKHMGTSYAYGRFNDVAGRVALDERDPARSQVAVAARTDSVDTGNSKRDQHLRGPDFFNAVQFPAVTFKSTRVARAPGAPDTYDVTGDLTLHGVTRPVTLRLEKTGAGKDMRGKPTLGVEGTFTVKRTDYGMGAMTGMLGDDVRVIVSLEAAAR